MLRHWWNQTDLRAKQFFFPRSFFLSLLNLAPLPLCRGSLWPTAETFRPSTTSTNFEALNYTASKGPIINPCGGGKEGTHKGGTWLRPCSVYPLTATGQLRELLVTASGLPGWGGTSGHHPVQPLSTTFLQWNCPGVSSIKPSQWAAPLWSANSALGSC